MVCNPHRRRTIYVSNLNEKTRINELKFALRSKFSGMGRIVGISASKRLELRGQAFIEFERADSATRAVQWMQGKLLFGKILRVRFANRETGEPRPDEVKLEAPDTDAAAKLAAMEIDDDRHATRGG